MSVASVERGTDRRMLRVGRSMPKQEHTSLFTYLLTYLRETSLICCCPGRHRGREWSQPAPSAQSRSQGDRAENDVIDVQERTTRKTQRSERPPPYEPFCVSQNQMHRIFTWYKNAGRSLFRFVTIRTFDRQTDRRTDRSVLAKTALHKMQRGKNHCR